MDHIEIDERLKQWEKQYLPIDVTLFGIEIDVSRIQFWKQDSPIDVTLFGIEMDLCSSHLENEYDEIVVTVSGIVKYEMFDGTIIISVLFLLYKIPSCLQ